MHDLIIPGSTLESIKLSPAELMIELACYLYDREKLTMGQAKKLAKLDQVSFQQELAKRDILIKYDLEELETDLENLAFG